MLREIFTLENLHLQAEKLVQRKFSPGFDGMDAKAAKLWIDINAKKLIRELVTGVYNPQPAVGFHTAKKDGHFRQLSKLTAIDTIIQNCIRDAISDTIMIYRIDTSSAVSRIQQSVVTTADLDGIL